MIFFSKSSPSARARWKAFRPTIEPKPPPALIWRISSKSSSVPFAGPPEKITIRLPLKAARTQYRTRSVSESSATPDFSKAFFASGCSMCALGV
jgi:hypothetical protein